MKFIEKQIEDTQTGAIANYHEITSINCDYTNNSVVATIASYVSKKARESSKNALSFNSFTFTQAMPSRGESAHDWALNQLVQPQPEGFVPEEYFGYVNPHMFANGKVKEADV